MGNNYNSAGCPALLSRVCNVTGECIPSSAICDDVDDCFDGEDESCNSSE